jgi:hypothetical protein
MAKHLYGKKSVKKNRWGKRAVFLGRRHRKSGRRLSKLL